MMIMMLRRCCCPTATAAATNPARAAFLRAPPHAAIVGNTTAAPTSHRFKSTVAAAAATTDDDDKVEQQQQQQQQQPTLQKVPKLPLLGSLWQPYSKLPVSMEQDRVFDFWPAMRQQYGTFYEFGLPGVGAGLMGTCYIIQDPQEMASILRQEGEFPRGAAEFSWGVAKFMKDRNLAAGGLLSHGPEWKRMRRFIQSDLLSPAAGARYVPAILESAAVASRGAPHFAAANKLNEYVNLASFDLFSNVIMGHIPKVSDPSSATDPEDVEFCYNVATALRIGSYFMTSATEGILNQGLGYKTAKYKEFEQHWEKAFEFGKRKVRELHKRKLDNSLSPQENDSYASMAYDRYAAELEEGKSADELVHFEEIDTIVGGLLAAGVDTTGGMLSFKLLHLAASPEIQDKLYHELQPTLVDGKLTRESLVVPYLNQFLRESHRVGSSAILQPIKTLMVDRDVHGHALPKGSVVILETYSTGQQQEYFLEDVRDIVPERFNKEAIAARKGTTAAVVDHSFFNGPFSQGARKCPGSRVANLEAHALVAQWVLDWKMELPTGINHFSEVPYDLETVTTATLPQIQFTTRDS